MLFLQSVVRRAEHELAELTAQMDSNGEFTELASASLGDSGSAALSGGRGPSDRRVARAVFPTTLGGLPWSLGCRPPRWPWPAGNRSGTRRGDRHALNGEQARRISPNSG